MKNIYKYTFPHSRDELPFVDIPYGSKPIRFDAQGDNFCLWAEVPADPDVVDEIFRTMPIRVQLFPTGAELHDNAIYVGTYIGPYVWHAYRIGFAPPAQLPATL